MSVIDTNTQQAFADQLQQAGGKLVVVDFFATWCGPCKMISPTIQAMSDEFKDVVFVKVDVDVNKAVSAQYQIQSMPTFLFIKNGGVVDRFSGADANRIRTTVLRLRELPHDIIPDGTQVKLVGLKSEQYNGRKGLIQSYDPERSRYVVHFNDNKNNDGPDQLAVRATNLFQLIRVSGGVLEGLEDDKYLLDNGEHVAVEDVVLPTGTVGFLRGLSSKPELNGKMVRVAGVDNETGRYFAQVEPEKQLKVKKTCVVVGPV
jgi:thioredoxin 1